MTLLEGAGIVGAVLLVLAAAWGVAALMWNARAAKRGGT
mgnify:CR=1 FL=1